MDRPSLVYAGHSYHRLTSSTQFLLDLLARHFRLSVVWDESWQPGGKRFSAAEINSHRPDIVLFFQTLPAPKHLRRLRCRRVFLVPMHDHVVGNPQSIWVDARPSGIRTINFCRATHEYFEGLGYESRYVQFWPPRATAAINPVDGIKIFFWMRKQEIGWRMLRALLGDLRPRRIVLRAAADPGQELDLPTPEDIAAFNIEIVTGWLERARYTELLQECNVFFAPRVNEGIGQAFLEAMAMGLAVVAPDSPTMNEYIRNGENGYLYRPDRPNTIDFTGVDAVRAQALADVTDGQGRWLSKEPELVDYLSTSGADQREWQWRLLSLVRR